jgi:hypothetical protein
MGMTMNTSVYLISDEFAEMMKVSAGGGMAGESKEKS